MAAVPDFFLDPYAAIIFFSVLLSSILVTSRKLGYTPQKRTKKSRNQRLQKERRIQTSNKGARRRIRVLSRIIINKGPHYIITSKSSIKSRNYHFNHGIVILSILSMSLKPHVTTFLVPQSTNAHNLHNCNLHRTRLCSLPVTSNNTA